MRRTFVCEGVVAWAAVLPLLVVGTQTAHITSVRQAYRLAVAVGLGHEASREVLLRKAIELVFASLVAARRLVVEPGGLEQLYATGAFSAICSMNTMSQTGLKRQLDQSQFILARRIAKEALRLELRAGRQMTPATAIRTPIAVKLIHAHCYAAMRLAERGFCVLDGALSLSDCRILYDHFNNALHREELFGPASSDACNKGSYSLLLPITIGAGPGPDNSIIKQQLALHPTKREAFAKALALRNALRVLIGLPAELQDRLNMNSGYSVDIPPTVMCACYPPVGHARYHKHKDWYSYERSNHRDITVILYPNANWTEEDGGELIIYSKSGTLESILPLAGRAVVFFSRTIWHEVRPATVRNRFALTLWLDRGGQRDGFDCVLDDHG